MKRDGHTYTKMEGEDGEGETDACTKIERKEEDKRGRHIHKDREGGR